MKISTKQYQATVNDPPSSSTQGDGDGERADQNRAVRLSITPFALSAFHQLPQGAAMTGSTSISQSTLNASTTQTTAPFPVNVAPYTPFLQPQLAFGFNGLPTAAGYPANTGPYTQITHPIETQTSIATNKPVDKKGSTKVKRANNRKKQKGQPKRPRTAYNYFFADEYRRIRQSLALSSDNDEDIGSSFLQDVVKAVVKNWKEISPEQRVHYQRKAHADRERFNREMTTPVPVMVPSQQPLQPQPVAPFLQPWACPPSTPVPHLFPPMTSPEHLMVPTQPTARINLQREFSTPQPSQRSTSQDAARVQSWSVPTGTPALAVASTPNELRTDTPQTSQVMVPVLLAQNTTVTPDEEVTM